MKKVPRPGALNKRGTAKREDGASRAIRSWGRTERLVLRQNSLRENDDWELQSLRLPHIWGACVAPKAGIRKPDFSVGQSNTRQSLALDLGARETNRCI